MIYVLTYEYGDRSAYEICGVTDNSLVARTWYEASEETNVYELSLNSVPVNWAQGINGWRQIAQEKFRADREREMLEAPVDRFGRVVQKDGQ